MADHDSYPRELTTERLRLRQWLESDREPFASLNADREVMAHFPDVLPREISDTFFDRIQDHFTRHGFGLWAVEIAGVTPFAGFIGLSVPRFDAPFMPAVEVGWRLARSFWGQGYATEGATAALGFGFRELKQSEIVSFTVVANARSRALMERLGMRHDPRDDFDHPALAEERYSRWRRHVLYRLAATDVPS